MKVSVFDTYVVKANGDTAHFDIIVPEGQHNLDGVVSFGKQYLNTLGEGGRPISAAECQFCHIETPTPEVVADIERQGYHVLVMGDIPAALPDNPSRRQLIEYIRSKNVELRFASFQGRTETELLAIISDLR